MRYCFDLDGTLCTISENLDYESAEPIHSRIKQVNKLYDEGNYIIIDTARGTLTRKNWYEVTKDQLAKWKVKYHQLKTGTKAAADVYIDDKAHNAADYFNNEDKNG